MPTDYEGWLAEVDEMLAYLAGYNAALNGKPRNFLLSRAWLNGYDAAFEIGDKDETS